MVSIINHYISFKTRDIMVPLLKILIRPVLNYENVVWCPNLKKHVLLLESMSYFLKMSKDVSLILILVIG